MGKDENEVEVGIEKNLTIIVDGTKRTVSPDDLSRNGEITYEQVLALSPHAIPTGPYIDIEVDYTNAIARPPDGQLAQGESVKIQNGTVFDVSITDRS